MTLVRLWTKQTVQYCTYRSILDAFLFNLQCTFGIESNGALLHCASNGEGFPSWRVPSLSPAANYECLVNNNKDVVHASLPSPKKVFYPSLPSYLFSLSLLVVLWRGNHVWTSIFIISSITLSSLDKRRIARPFFTDNNTLYFLL